MPLVDPITVQIKNLAPETVLDLLDEFPFQKKSNSATKKGKIGDLVALITTPGVQVLPPVYYAGEIIHDTNDYPSELGTQIASIPSIAGMQFSLTRDGYPLKRNLVAPPADPDPTADYDILTAGGFKLLKAGDNLAADQRFVLKLYDLLLGPAPSGSSSFVNGVVPIATNFTIVPANHLNKLLQIRALGTKITITLPSVLDTPENTIIPLEAVINNSFQAKIQTVLGQNIYLNNGSKTALWIAPGESLWLFRAADGWYIINDFADNYKSLGRPISSFEIGLNELICKGQSVLREDYPRLWEKIQSFGGALVSEATWQVPSEILSGRTVLRPHRGKFSTGDGATTFRIPDLMNVALRGVLSETGSDTERFSNVPGGFQRHEVETHVHQVVPPNSNDQTNFGKTTTGNSATEGTITSYPTLAFGGLETRMDNVGVYWVIKV